MGPLSGFWTLGVGGGGGGGGGGKPQSSNDRQEKTQDKDVEYFTSTLPIFSYILNFLSFFHRKRRKTELRYSYSSMDVLVKLDLIVQFFVMEKIRIEF